MTRPTAAELADWLAGSHARWFAENPMGQLPSVCLIEPAEGPDVYVPCGWADATHRAVSLCLLRLLVAEAKAVRYAIWSEVWAKHVSVPAGQEPAEHASRFAKGYRHGELAKDPDRREMVFTLVVEPDGRTTTRVQTIERGRKGGVRRLVLEDNTGLTDMGGDLADLFPERPLN